MSKAKSIKRNYIYNLIYQVFLVLTPLITAPYLSRVLGASGLGTYGYMLTICSYFILFADLGAAAYGTREIAYVRDDKAKKTKTFWEIFLLKAITTGLSTVAYVILSCFATEYKTLYYILTINLMAGAFDISWFFYGVEEFKSIVLRNIVLRVLSIVAILVFVKSIDDLAVYALISAGTALLGNIVLWPSLKNELGQNKSGTTVKPFRHLRGVIGLFIPQIAIQIYMLVDKTMIGSISPDISEVGYYEQSQKIIKLLLTVVTTLGTVISPRIAYMYSKKNHKGVENFIAKSFKIMAFIAFPLMFGIVVASESFVPIFFGQGFEPVKILMPIISPIIVLIGASNILGVQYLLPTKRNKDYTTSVIVGACVNVIVNFIAIPKWGALGASFGTVVAELCVLLVQVFAVRRDIKLGKIFKGTWRYLVAAFAMLGACICAKVVVNTYGLSDMISLITIIAIGMVVYPGMLIIMKDESVVMVKNEFKKRWRRNE